MSSGLKFAIMCLLVLLLINMLSTLGFQNNMPEGFENEGDNIENKFMLKDEDEDD